MRGPWLAQECGLTVGRSVHRADLYMSDVDMTESGTYTPPVFRPYPRVTIKPSQDVQAHSWT